MNDATIAVNRPDLAFSAPMATVVTSTPPPGNQPLKANTGNPGKSEVATDYIKPSLIKYPMYDYQTGNQWFLSKQEKIVVDAYLKTNSQTEACRTLNAIRAAHGSTKFVSQNAVTAWLKKPHVAAHIAQGFLDQGKVNWFTPEKWEAWGVDTMQGKIPVTQVQVAVWKEFGKAKGWYKDTGPQNMTNMQINFVQSDGRA